MKKISIFKTLLCGAMFVLGSTAVFGQGTFETPIFSEDFGNLADGTALSTSNTAFSYVRVGTGSSGAGTNKVAAKSPSSFTGSSMVQGARTASISTIDKTGMASFNKGAFTFKVKTPASLSGATLFSAVGAGASFASANAFTSAQLSTAFQINGTNLQVRAGGAWTTVQTVETSTSYTIALIFNNSGSDLTYGANEDLANNKVHVYVNGEKKGEYNTANNLAATAFRIYTQSGGDFEVDDIAVYNTLPVPACTAPVITTQPTDVSVVTGAAATFTVVATGDNLTYQWQALEEDQWFDLNYNGSATTASWNIPTTEEWMNNAKFRVVISSGTCSTISDVVTLTVTPPLNVENLTAKKITLVKNTIVSNELIFGAAAKVSVYNAAGQVVKTAEVAENSKLDVSALAKGTYIVAGVVNGQTVSQKIIKN